MTSLQLGLIVAGVVLVAGVIVYNWLQERRIRRRIDATFRKPQSADGSADSLTTRRAERVEPTFSASDRGDTAAYVSPENPLREGTLADEASDADGDPPSKRGPGSCPISRPIKRTRHRRRLRERLIAMSLLPSQRQDPRSARASQHNPTPTSNAWSQCNPCGR